MMVVSFNPFVVDLHSNGYGTGTDATDENCYESIFGWSSQLAHEFRTAVTIDSALTRTISGNSFISNAIGACYPNCTLVSICYFEA